MGGWVDGWVGGLLTTRDIHHFIRHTNVLGIGTHVVRRGHHHKGDGAFVLLEERVGGWVRWGEEKEAVGMSYCTSFSHPPISYPQQRIRTAFPSSTQPTHPPIPETSRTPSVEWNESP